MNLNGIFHTLNNIENSKIIVINSTQFSNIEQSELSMKPWILTFYDILIGINAIYNNWNVLVWFLYWFEKGIPKAKTMMRVAHTNRHTRHVIDLINLFKIQIDRYSFFYLSSLFLIENRKKRKRAKKNGWKGRGREERNDTRDHCTKSLQFN